MEPVQFVDRLRGLKAENTFNPYADRCDFHDLDEAPNIRMQTLLAILEAAANSEVDSLWIGRDLGFRGGRRTGLAFTDDPHIGAHANRWGLSASRPTKGYPIKERTASIVWSALSRIEQTVFLWNVFPFHPHEPGNQFSNRSHSKHERHFGESILQQLVDILSPVRLIAVGKVAEQSVLHLGFDCEVVRHPSYGGKTEFLSRISELYDQTKQNCSIPHLTDRGTSATHPCSQTQFASQALCWE